MSTTAATSRIRTGAAGVPRGPSSALAAAMLGFFVITLDAVVVNVALPSIRRGLGGGITGLQWVVDGYVLMFAALLLSAGSLSDRVGAHRAFGAGLVVFVVASMACALAPGMEALVAARFVQGAAAAVMMPSSMALIGQTYPDPIRRARAVGMWAMGGAVASISGPVLGGPLTLASWRLIFFINLPVGAVALILLARTARSPHRPVPFDWIGQVTAVLAMSGLTYGAIEAGAAGFTTPAVVTAFAVAVVAMAAFVVAQARGAHPMVLPDLFRTRAVTVGFAFVVGYYGLPFVMSLYLQQLRGLTSLATGLTFLPMMLIGAFVTAFSARLVERLGAGAHHRRAGPDDRGPGQPRPRPALDTGLGAGRANGSGGPGRPADHAAGDRGPAQQRPGPPNRHGQRRVQHQPADRRRSGRGRLRCAAGRPGDLPARSAHQPADRRSGGAGRRRRPAAPAPTHDDEGGLISTWTPDELDGQAVPGTDIGVSSLGGWCIY
jgi:DHA2 family methylenomycin A resistance protein-like MFS transporter